MESPGRIRNICFLITHTTCCLLIFLLRKKLRLVSPEYNDNAVKDIESIGDVPERSFGHHLEQHFHSEDAGEDHIAGLHDGRELRWLVVVLDAHGERVDQDGQEDALLEVLVLHQAADVAPDPAADPREAAVDGDQAAGGGRPLALALVQRGEGVLVEIVAAGIVLHVVAGGGMGRVPVDAAGGCRWPRAAIVAAVACRVVVVVVVVVVVRRGLVVLMVLLASVVRRWHHFGASGSTTAISNHSRHGGGFQFPRLAGLRSACLARLGRSRCGGAWLVAMMRPQGLGGVGIAAGQRGVERFEGALAGGQGGREGDGEGQ